MDPLQAKVLEFIRAHGLLREGEKVVVALSGGPDSVALALILKDLSQEGGLNLQLHLAHLNHGLRGEESDADEAFCRRLAEELCLPISLSRANVRSLAASRQISCIEAASREARYDFLGRVAAQTGSAAIALGHQADDVAETVLLRLLRGAGLRGLAAMAPQRPLSRAQPQIRLVRPLLEVRRAKLLEFLAARQQPFRADTTNLSLAYARNKVRHILLPLLQREFPSFSVESLCALNRSALEVRRLLEEMLAQKWNALCVQQTTDVVALDAQALSDMAAPLRKAALMRALELLASAETPPLGLRAKLLEAFASLPSEPVGAEITLTRSFFARREHGTVLVSRRQATGGLPLRPLPVPGYVELPELKIRLRAKILPPGSVALDTVRATAPNQAHVSLDAIRAPLSVRSRLPGDRFQPLGAGAPRRLKSFLIARKVPRHQRDLIPLVVTSEGEIVWVAGHEVGERFKLTSSEQPILHMRLEQGISAALE